MSTVIIITLSLLLGLAVGCIVGTSFERRRGERQLEALRSDKAKAESALAESRQKEAAMRLWLEQEQARAEEQRHTLQQAQQQQNSLLKAELQNFMSQLGKEQASALRHDNIEQLSAMLNPLGQEIKDFRDKFAQTNAGFDARMRDLIEQAQKMSRDAGELTRALKNESKTQGNWGEGILRNLLKASGLTEGTDYSLQASTRTDEQQRLVPDVVVHLPSGQNLVVDSKVSLTSFIDYANATTDDMRQSALKAHLASVKKHVSELAAKGYSQHVRNAVGYVLMFIPNEAAYVAAVQNDDHLITDAYRQKVIVVNPTNLLMALQLTLSLWQTERQQKNVEKIYDSARRLYEKFCTFAKSYEEVGSRIKQLDAAYSNSQRQLSTGKGNILGQLRDWTQTKGLQTGKQLPPSMEADAETA